MTQTVDASPPISIADPFDAGPFTRLRAPRAVLPLGASSVVRLALIARHLGVAGLVSDADRPRYEELIASSRRSLHSRSAGIVIVLIACAATLLLWRSTGAAPFAGTASTWVAPLVDGTRALSLAGIWRQVVSEPLLLVLLFAWLWRLALWTRFLRGVARLDLRLVPAHPDLAGGLRFVSTSLPPFAAFALALGAWMAGGLANAVLHDALPARVRVRRGRPRARRAGALRGSAPHALGSPPARSAPWRVRVRKDCVVANVRSLAYEAQCRLAERARGDHGRVARVLRARVAAPRCGRSCRAVARGGSVRRDIPHLRVRHLCRSKRSPVGMRKNTSTSSTPN